MEPTLKRKVAVKFTYTEPSPSRPTSRTTISRPVSPVKFQPSQSSLPHATVIKPRAKINSSATPTSRTKSASTRSTAPVGSRPGTSEGPTPRATSPTKPPPRVRDTLSPTFRPKIRTDVKPSTTGTPQLRHRSQTSASSDAGSFTPELRVRRESVSLHHAASFSSFQGSNLSSEASYAVPLSTEHATHSDNEEKHSSSTRIKSKVSGIVKPTGDSLSPSTSQLSYSATRSGNLRSRTPSVSFNTVRLTSPSPPSQPPPFYPITTATAAANPHRFSPSLQRFSQTERSHYIPPPHPQKNSNITDIRVNGFGKVDPATIPLPPTSPPTSAVSISSHSSISLSSVSHTAGSIDSGSSVPSYAGSNNQLRSTLNNLLLYTDTISGEANHSDDSVLSKETDSETNVAERKVKAEAKSIRKIADLEITNRSLLAINASLESVKHRQAKEIRELRRKLRESRLILPPRAYRAVRSSLDHDDTADDDDEEDTNEGDEGDEVYQRIKGILEGLLDTGRRALNRKMDEFPEGGKGTAKVLNADEVRTWQDSGDSQSSMDEGDHAFNTEENTLISPSHVAIPDSDEAFDSEDEVEAMTLTNDSLSSSPAPPPILVTH